MDRRSSTKRRITRSSSTTNNYNTIDETTTTTTETTTSSTFTTTISKRRRLNNSTTTTTSNNSNNSISTSTLPKWATLNLPKFPVSNETIITRDDSGLGHRCCSRRRVEPISDEREEQEEDFAGMSSSSLSSYLNTKAYNCTTNFYIRGNLLKTIYELVPSSLVRILYSNDKHAMINQSSVNDESNNICNSNRNEASSLSTTTYPPTSKATIQQLIVEENNTHKDKINNNNDEKNNNDNNRNFNRYCIPYRNQRRKSDNTNTTTARHKNDTSYETLPITILRDPYFDKVDRQFWVNTIFLDFINNPYSCLSSSGSGSNKEEQSDKQKRIQDNDIIIIHITSLLGGIRQQLIENVPPQYQSIVEFLIDTTSSSKRNQNNRTSTDCDEELNNSHNDNNNNKKFLLLLDLDQCEDLYDSNKFLDALQYCGYLRKELLLDISILLWEPNNEFRKQLSMRQLSGVVLDVTHVQLPTSEEILNTFWKRVQTHLPPLSDDCNRMGRLNYLYRHHSFVRVVEELQLRIAYALGGSQGRCDNYWSCLHLMKEYGGTFLHRRALLSRLVVVDNDDTDDKQRKERQRRRRHDKRNIQLQNWTQSYEMAKWKAHVAWKVFDEIICWKATSPATNTDPMNAEPTMFRLFGAVNERQLTKEDKEKAIRLLGELRRSCTEWICLSHVMIGDNIRMSILKEVTTYINELIIFLHHFTALSEVHICLRETINNWNLHSLSPFSSTRTKEGQELPHSSYCHHPQPRHDLARELLREKEEEEVMNNIDIPSCLYRILVHRTSIGQGELFQTFMELNSSEDVDNDDVDLFHKFGCGIRQLQASGLIRVRSGKTETIFEKTTVVWSK